MSDRNIRNDKKRLLEDDWGGVSVYSASIPIAPITVKCAKGHTSIRRPHDDANYCLLCFTEWLTQTFPVERED